MIEVLRKGDDYQVSMDKKVLEISIQATQFILNDRSDIMEIDIISQVSENEIKYLLDKLHQVKLKDNNKNTMLLARKDLWLFGDIISYADNFLDEKFNDEDYDLIDIISETLHKAL